MPIRKDIDNPIVVDRSVSGPAPDTGPSSSGSSSGKSTSLAELSGAADLKVIEALASSGLLARTGSEQWATRAIVHDASLSGLLSLSNGDGVAGDPTVSLSDQVANLVFAGPSSGANATPEFRALVNEDIPQTLQVDTIQTSDPTGGTANTWKLGSYSATPPTPDGNIRIQIGAETYLVPAELSSSTWSPTDITDCGLWLDGDDPSTMYDATSGGSPVSADGLIARWEDKSGNDRHATQSSSSEQPTRKDAIQNSRGVVRFSAGSRWLDLPSTWFSLDAVTWFLVMQYGAASSMQYAMAARNSGSGNSKRFYVRREDTSETFEFIAGDSATFATHTGNDAWRLHSGKLDGSTHLYRLDGVDDSTSQAATSTPDHMSIGILPSTAGTPANSDFFLGDIAEIIVYTRALSGSEIDEVEGELQTKWGTPALS